MVNDTSAEVSETTNKFDIMMIKESDILDPADPIWMANSSNLREYLDLNKGQKDDSSKLSQLESRYEKLRQIHNLSWKDVWALRDSITEEYFSLGTSHDKDDHQQRRYMNLQAVFATCNERINRLNGQNINKINKPDITSSTPEPIPQQKEFESGFICINPEESRFCSIPEVSVKLMHSLLALGSARANETAARENNKIDEANKYKSLVEDSLQEAKILSFELGLCFESGMVCANCSIRNLIPQKTISNWEKNSQNTLRDPKKD